MLVCGKNAAVVEEQRLHASPHGGSCIMIVSINGEFTRVRLRM